MFQLYKNIQTDFPGWSYFNLKLRHFFWDTQYVNFTLNVNNLQPEESHPNGTKSVDYGNQQL